MFSGLGKVHISTSNPVDSGPTATAFALPGGGDGGGVVRVRAGRDDADGLRNADGSIHGLGDGGADDHDGDAAITEAAPSYRRWARARAAAEAAVPEQRALGALPHRHFPDKA